MVSCFFKRITDHELCEEWSFYLLAIKISEVKVWEGILRLAPSPSHL